MSELSKEEQRFQRTLKNGMKEFDRVKDKAENGVIDGLTAFHLYDTFGFPVEFTQEMAKENGLQVDLEGFKKAFDQHQEKSKAGAEQRFKGGLADTSEQTAGSIAPPTCCRRPCVGYCRTIPSASGVPTSPQSGCVLISALAGRLRQRSSRRWKTR